MPPAEVERRAPELLYHLMTDDTAVESFVTTDPAAPGAFSPAWVQRVAARASRPLADALGA